MEVSRCKLEMSDSSLSHELMKSRKIQMPPSFFSFFSNVVVGGDGN